MHNPLTKEYSEEENLGLVSAILDGDAKALDKLIEVHQAFVYNVAWKMTHDTDDALDLTQEVWIKVITKLSTFKQKSAFRTWLYRIVFNEFLQTKRKKKEEMFPDFETHDQSLNAVPDLSLSPEEELEIKDFSREVKFRCTSAMLICLDREQRLVYLLGHVFQVDHNVGAEILNISKQNFRVKLSRARKELHNYMEYRCGLINKSNPCRCSKKAKAALKIGAITPDNLIFKESYTKEIRDFVSENQPTMKSLIDEKYVEIYRSHPSRSKFNSETIVNTIIRDKTVQSLFRI